jgi:hypothetical protein
MVDRYTKFVLTVMRRRVVIVVRDLAPGAGRDGAGGWRPANYS